MPTASINLVPRAFLKLSSFRGRVPCLFVRLSDNVVWVRRRTISLGSRPEKVLVGVEVGLLGGLGN